MKKAVVLLSGGLDSATALYCARKAGYRPYCLIFDYGQRHRKEIVSARRVAEQSGAAYHLIPFTLPWKGSALLDDALEVPSHRTDIGAGIPATYVPSRNTIFLSFAMSWAEAIGADAVYIGANALDYSGYPDCRPAYFDHIRTLFAIGTKAGVEGKKIEIRAPLISMTKAEIVRLGTSLGVPYDLTWSCYQGGEVPCGVCDSCRLREKGFREAGLADPLLAGVGIPKGRVVEIFRSIQGEGKYQGNTMIFIRLAGCNIGACSYCDTDYGKYVEMDIPAAARAILDVRGDSGAGYVAVTGGEPLLQIDFLRGLAPLLRAQGLKILLETNGTLPAAFQALSQHIDTVSMDMKLPSALAGRSFWDEHEEFIRRALTRDLYIKIVVGGGTGDGEFIRALRVIHSIDRSLPVFLQPETGPDGRFTVTTERLDQLYRIAASACKNARIVPQIQKVLGVA